MLISFGKAKMILGLLALGGTLSGPPQHESPQRERPQHGTSQHGTRQQILMIRVSQESSPGAGDFDKNILGFIRALQSNGVASDFYEYGRNSANYGNTEPVLTANTSHVFFVNASDGLCLFVVHNNSNHPENGAGGSANTRWELTGGTADVVLSDDAGEGVASDGGTVFTGTMDWAQSNTDGMVIGALPVGFSILGQFTAPPTGLNGGWEVISADGSKIILSLVPGQRVRLDVKLAVQVRQDH